MDGLRCDEFDVVLVKFRDEGIPYLFEAPKYSHISAGTDVMVETVNEDGDGVVLAKAKVIRSTNINIRYDKEELEMLIEACRATLPLRRVRSIITVNELEYDDED